MCQSASVSVTYFVQSINVVNDFDSDNSVNSTLHAVSLGFPGETMIIDNDMLNS